MPNTELETATVVASFGRRLLLEIEGQGLTRAILRNRDLRPLCGDRVVYSRYNDEAIIESITPRNSNLWRQDKTVVKRAVAANVDTMVVVAAPEPLTSAGQIDRYLAIATLCGLDTIIIKNKYDVETYAEWAQTADNYASLGYEVLASSAKSGTGVTELKQYLTNRHAVMAGLSGAGKSSLINALIPDVEARTAALSAASGGGRHTTTASRLYRLSTEGWIIDAPGVRDIRLWSMSAAELAQGFIEFTDYTSQCKFNNCRHLDEPHCAVQAAVTAGAIEARRYRNFCSLAERLSTGP